MKCPVCKSDDHGVIDSVDKDDAIRRRRRCGRCRHRWTTFERNEAAIATFDRDAAREHVRALETLLGGQG
jgi:transcriptional repressor NrdR